jgi:hypothetical protein
MQKQRIVKVGCILLVLAMIFSLAACGQQKETGKPADSGKKQFLRIGTASMGGNFFPLGSAIAQLINDKIPGVNASAQATGGSAENCNFLEQGEVELALVQSETLGDAYNGVESFKGHAIKSLRGITSIYFNQFHILVRKDSGINTVADMKGKRIAVGPMAGGIEINTDKILQAYGITKNDYKPIYGTREEATEFLKTNRADVHIYATGLGSSQITDLMSTGDIKLISLEEDKIKAIIEKNPIFGRDIIPKGTYKNQDTDIVTVVGGSLLVTTDKMPEDVIYKVTKTIFENKETLVTAHKYFKQTDAKTATRSMATPLHPGAEKYLKEVGAIK